MNRKNMIEALKEIQNECKNNVICETCKLYNNVDECLCILNTDEIPESWLIAE